VPKKELVTCLQVVMQSRRLRIARGLHEAALLVRELQQFQVKITTAANETFGVWREGQHDDLVLAVALACWWAERCPPLGNVNDLNWSRARKARGAVIDIVT